MKEIPLALCDHVLVNVSGSSASQVSGSRTLVDFILASSMKIDARWERSPTAGNVSQSCYLTTIASRLLVLSQAVYGLLTDSEDVHRGGLWRVAGVLCYRVVVARIKTAERCGGSSKESPLGSRESLGKLSYAAPSISPRG